MRRAIALLSIALLLAAFVPIGTATAADSTHIRLTRTGAIVSFAEVHDGILINTELSASSEASRDITTGPLLWINQAAYAPDTTGEFNILLWGITGSTTDFALTIADRLASATVSAPALPVDRCDPDGNCTQETLAVSASFTAAGETVHSHQRSIGSVSHQSLFVYNLVGTARFANASVVIDGVVYGPSTGLSDASIYDTKTGTMDVTRAKPGVKVALPAGVTVYDTTETPTGRRTGESMFATWSSESDGIGRFTVLAASSQRVSSKGTVINQKSVGYDEQVYSFDEFGNPVTISDTFSGDQGTATTVSVDKTLGTGIVAGGSIPATSCTYIDDEILCIDTLVHADGQWTGYGTTTKTRDGTTAGTAGVIVIVYHNVTTHRAATATATIDGVTFTGSGDGAVDRATTGFHEVHIGH